MAAVAGGDCGDVLAGGTDWGAAVGVVNGRLSHSHGAVWLVGRKYANAVADGNGRSLRPRSRHPRRHLDSPQPTRRKAAPPRAGCHANHARLCLPHPRSSVFWRSSRPEHHRHHYLRPPAHHSPHQPRHPHRPRRRIGSGRSVWSHRTAAFARRAVAACHAYHHGWRQPNHHDGAQHRRHRRPHRCRWVGGCCPQIAAPFAGGSRSRSRVSHRLYGRAA